VRSSLAYPGLDDLQTFGPHVRAEYYVDDEDSKKGSGRL